MSQAARPAAGQCEPVLETETHALATRAHRPIVAAGQHLPHSTPRRVPCPVEIVSACQITRTHKNLPRLLGPKGRCAGPCDPVTKALDLSHIQQPKDSSVGRLARASGSDPQRYKAKCWVARPSKTRPLGEPLPRSRGKSAREGGVCARLEHDETKADGRRHRRYLNPAEQTGDAASFCWTHARTPGGATRSETKPVAETLRESSRVINARRAACEATEGRMRISE